MGSPGIPDKKRGVLLFSNNLGFRNAPLKDEIQKYFDLPVHLENDANVAALAESMAGASKDADHSVLITLGTGIGGGIIIDNRIYSGFNDAGSELGHMVIVHDGIRCSCGRRGCFEKYASAAALIEQTRQAATAHPESKINEITDGDHDKINAKTAFEVQKIGDETADRVISEYLDYLADGVMNIINMLFPEVVVIGGGLGNEGENLFAPLRQRLEKMEYTNDVTHTRITGALMGNKAGMIGAAMLGKIT
jgi:glucokinase